MAVGGEREEDEYRGGVGTEVAQPSIVQQAVVEPTEAALGPPQKVWPRRQRRRPHQRSSPGPRRLRLALRSLALRTGRLDEAAAALRDAADRSLDDDIRLAALNALGSVLFDQDRPRAARMVFDQALAVGRELFPDGGTGYVHALYNSGMGLLGVGETARGEAVLRDALAEGERVFGKEHPLLSPILTALAASYRDGARDMAAAELCERALAMRERALPDDHPSLAETRNRYGNMLLEQRRFREAARYYERALAVFRELHPDGHRKIAIMVSNLGHAQALMGQLADAEECVREASTLIERLGLSPLRAAYVEWLRAEIAWQRGDWEQVLRSTETVLTSFGEDLALASDRGWVLGVRASALNFLGRSDEAVVVAIEAIELFRGRQKGRGSVGLAMAHYQLGWGRFGQRRFAESEAALRDAVAMYRQLFPDGHEWEPWPLEMLASILAGRDSGFTPEAEAVREEIVALRRRSLRIRERTTPATSLDVLTARLNLGVALAKVSKEEAYPVFEEVLTQLDQGHDGSVRARSLHGVALHEWGVILIELGRVEEAVEELERGVEIEREVHGRHFNTARTLLMVGRAHALLARHDAAEAAFAEADAMFEEVTPGHPSQRYLHRLMADHRERSGEFAEASADRGSGRR